MHELQANIDRLNIRKSGEIRVIKNLALTTDDVLDWCKKLILNEKTVFESDRKHWYAYLGNDMLIVLMASYTVASGLRNAYARSSL